MYARFEPAYFIKSAPYETVEELRLVYGMDLGILFGEDANLNGALDPGETDTNRNNVADAGILDWVTVYSREPAAVPGGSEPINVRSLNASTARALLQTNVTTARLNEILLALGLGST
ncbi:hypothetical protein EG831_12225, partial [bacterium]|nr:hypothetical protein [bacterium]